MAQSKPKKNAKKPETEEGFLAGMKKAISDAVQSVKDSITQKDGTKGEGTGGRKRKAKIDEQIEEAGG